MLQSPLLQLPVELLCLIIDNLHGADQRSLSSCCKDLRAIIAPIAFKTVTLLPMKPRLRTKGKFSNHGMPQLEANANSQPFFNLVETIFATLTTRTVRLATYIPLMSNLSSLDIRFFENSILTDLYDIVRHSPTIKHLGLHPLLGAEEDLRPFSDPPTCRLESLLVPIHVVRDLLVDHESPTQESLQSIELCFSWQYWDLLSQCASKLVSLRRVTLTKNHYAGRKDLCTIFANLPALAELIIGWDVYLPRHSDPKFRFQCLRRMELSSSAAVALMPHAQSSLEQVHLVLNGLLRGDTLDPEALGEAFNVCQELKEVTVFNEDWQHKSFIKLLETLSPMPFRQLQYLSLNHYTEDRTLEFAEAFEQVAEALKNKVSPGCVIDLKLPGVNDLTHATLSDSRTKRGVFKSSIKWLQMHCHNLIISWAARPQELLLNSVSLHSLP
ncbi:hypothetical protein FRC17_004932, partial [Serendipita sp. 399]